MGVNAVLLGENDGPGPFPTQISLGSTSVFFYSHFLFSIWMEKKT